MAGPTSPAAEGPSFAPPSLPAGWIAQWDGASKKYYFVQLATGVSQWEVPTEPAQTGSTPAQQIDHPYGTPQPELITHPDGSQTVRHPDGTMEPIMPDGTRGVDGPAGDRGLGTMAMNALLGGKNSSHSGGSSSSPLGSLASQFLGGSHGGSSHSGGGKSSAGKLVGQLASSFMNSSNSNKPPQPQNYHGGQTSGQGQHAPPSGGLAGSVMGGVAHMFGGKPSHGNNGQNFGYSHAGHSGGYTGEAPTYHPGGSGGGHPPASAPPAAGNQNYHSPPPNQHTPQHQPQYGVNQHQQPQHQNSFPPPPGSMGQPQHQQQHQQQHNQSYPPPPSGGPPMSHGASQGHQNYPPPPNQQQHGAPQIPGNYPPPPNSYGSQPQYGSPQGGYNPQFNGPPGGQPQYGGQQHQQQQHYGGGAPPVPHGSHPNYGQQPY